MLQRSHSKQTELKNRKHSEINANSHKNIYNALPYFKKWLTFNTMKKYKMINTDINDMNKYQFSNFIKSIMIDDNQKKMIQQNLSKLLTYNILKLITKT